MTIDLPFFDDSHRALAARLAGLRATFEPIAARGEEGAVDEAARDALRACAQQGLCRLLVPRELGGGKWSR